MAASALTHNELEVNFIMFCFLLFCLLDFYFCFCFCWLPFPFKNPSQAPMHKKAEGSTKESTKESTKKVEGLRGKGRSGTSVVTRPPVCASLTSGGSLSGVVGGGVVPSGSSGSCEVPPHDLICGKQEKEQD